MSWESGLAADIQNPAKPVESCCSTYLTCPDVRCFEGKMLLICIGSSPKRLRFMGKCWDWLQALFQLSLCGVHPSFLISQLRGKRTRDVWNLEPGCVFWDPLKWEPTWSSQLPGDIVKNTRWGSFDSLEAWVLQFSIASGEMLMLRLVEETLIELGRVTVTFYRRGNNTGRKNARSMRKWRKPELCHLLALCLGRVTESPQALVFLI